MRKPDNIRQVLKRKENQNVTQVFDTQIVLNHTSLENTLHKNVFMSTTMMLTIVTEFVQSYRECR